MAPMSGGLGPYLQKGEWQFSGSLNRYATDELFRAYDYVPTPNPVIEGGDTLDLQANYGLTRRLNLTVDIPIVLWSHWSTVIAGTRYDAKAHGLSDTVFGGRFWLLNPKKHAKENLALGLALRLPTGNSNYLVPYPDSKGQNITFRPVHPAIQVGSGATGLRLSVQGFRAFRHFSVSGTGLYVFSLKEQNNTLAFGAALNPAGPQAVAANVRYLSTPDSYLFNGSVASPIPYLKGMAATLGGKIAGVPTWNAVTSTIGYRQPGYIVTMDPGLAWNTSFASYFISMPLRMHQYVGLDFTGSQKTADFSKIQLQFGIQFHIGGKQKTSDPTGDAAGKPTK
jgi:hypothetical protein